MANSVQTLEINQISQIYVGKDNVCRCGCAGHYVSTSFMESPRSEVNDKLALQRLNKAKKLVNEGAEIIVEDTYINVSYGNDRAITIYLDEVKK